MNFFNILIFYPLALLLTFLPFIGVFLVLTFGRVHKSLSFYISELITLSLFLISLYLFNANSPIEFSVEWFKFGNETISLGIYIDNLSLIMLLIASGLGFLDIHFSHDYMKDEIEQIRYYSKMLFFIGGMIILVVAKDLITLFIGWEFMGLASYLLISFWHYNIAPADAGVRAFLYTRFGDIFLFGAIGILFLVTQSLDIETINYMAKSGQINSSILYLIAIFIFIGAIGKSGQFPLFPWLMRAMEGPTTVSALIHGATMVNAGIYIVARMFDLYIASQTLLIVAGVASLSAFIGASSAIAQDEMKKVLAYSTMSHLSLAFIGLGIGSLTLGVAHLTNHAIFKALLFLSVGAVILATHHTKKMQPLGGLKSKMPLIAIFMGFGALSLSGIYPFSGFFSKDAIIGNSLGLGIIGIFTLLAGLLSVVYISRVWILLFLGTPRDKDIFEKTKKSSFFWISLPLFIMAIATLVLGFFQEELYSFIAPYEAHHNIYLMITLLITIVLLFLITYFFYKKAPHLREKLFAQSFMNIIKQLLFNGYYVEAIIEWLSKNIIKESVAKAISWFNDVVIDGLVNSVKTLFQWLFKLALKTDKEEVSIQSSITLFGVFLFLIVILIRSFV